MRNTPKRLLTILLLMCLALPAVMVAGETDELVVGSNTGISGEFMAGMWGNNTTDVDVRLLLHDYPTIVWQTGEMASINQVAVQNMERQTDESGNQVYTFALNNNLRYSDGSAITAADYVFSALLQASPLIRELGGTNASWDHLVGAIAYTSGSEPVFSGIRLLDRLRFSLTVSKDYLPYYYELSYVHLLPYPISVIAPGCQVEDNGQGAYLTGDFTSEMLANTLLDPVSGYLSHPKVTSGAYRLVSSDLLVKTATFEVNPYYLGNRERKKPAIQRIRLVEVRNADMAQLLSDGQVHLINKISAADAVDAVAALPAGQSATAAYPRNGFAYLAFAVERDLPSSELLRQALSSMVDKGFVTRNFLRQYGEPVYAYYSLAQWMAQQDLVALEALDKYPFDLNQAEALLEQDGWVLQQDGTPYQKDADGLRHKQAGEGLVPLRLIMGLAPNNQAADIAFAHLSANLQQLGGELEAHYLPMGDLLRQYYRQEERVVDLLFLASNFGHIFDPYPTYMTTDNYQGIQNTSGLQDETLLSLAKTLRQTLPGDQTTYYANWLAFQQHWVDVLPMIPLYTNTYTDAFTPRLTGYHPEQYDSWAVAILYADFK